MSTPTESFSCTICEVTFKRSYQLDVHTRKHTGERPFKCRYCNYAARSHDTLRRHVQTGRTLPLKCEDCDFKFCTGEALRRHQKESHWFMPSEESSVRRKPAEPPISETVAWKVRKKASPVVILPSKITAEEISQAIGLSDDVIKTKEMISCSLCDFICYDSSKLKDHVLFSRPGPPLRCHQCSFQCCTSSGIMAHRMEVHHSLAITTSAEEVCKKKLLVTLKKDRIVTKDRAHRRKCDNKCSYCGKKFKLRTSLAIHIASHVGKQPLKCSHCGYVCTDASDMREHGKARRNAIHKCSNCKLRFCRRALLLKHVKFCRGPLLDSTFNPKKPFGQKSGKPHSCSYCNKTFRDRSRLGEHIRMHTGEKPFKCDRCSFTSAHTSGLLIHKRCRTSVIHNCPECTFTSCNEVFLLLHMKKSHNDIWVSLRKKRKTPGISNVTLKLRKKSVEKDPDYHSGHRKPKTPSCKNVRGKDKGILCRSKKLKEGVGKKDNQISTEGKLKKVITCEFCSYESNQKGRMVRHTRTHTGEKPYKCSICPHKSARKDDMKMHELKHGKNHIP